MTFTIPADLATSFTKRVPARDRSKYVAAALAEKLSQREKRLILACEIVNGDSAVKEIEEEFDALNDPIAESWKNGPTR